MINFTEIETPIGNMVVCSTKQGICLLEFEDRKELTDELKSLPILFNAALIMGSNLHIEQLKTQLAEYFSGVRTQFTISLETKGTPFQQSVWQALQQIPYGETRSYKEQARILGKPETIRAVANANGKNRISILIPCHRVLGSNGALTGYAGGLWRKEYLLKLESASTKPNH